jgi:membrane dipeptidase
MSSLDRRHFLALSALSLIGAAAPGLRRDEDDHWDGYGRSLVVDGLGGPGDPASESPTTPLTAIDLDHVRASGITAANLTVSAVGELAGAFEETVRQIAFWDGEIDAHPDVLLKVKSPDDLGKAKESHRLGLIYGFQDTLPIGQDLDRLATFRKLGVRIIQLTYNRRNLCGDGCLEPADGGLSRLGQQVVERMNELKILLDLSHAGRQTTLDAIKTSKRPVAITHTGCAAIADRPRNRTDDELRCLADKGGVAGIYLMPFLREKGQPMAEDVVRHIEHALKVCGEDHVGIGTDGPISPTNLSDEYKRLHREFILKRRKLGISAPGEDENVYLFIPDLNTPRRFETIAVHLQRRGHSDSCVAKVLGGNFARLFRETWG